jgi:methylase of polypeptide subunit release factors
MPTAERRWAAVPFRLGSRDEFARLREVLQALGYTEPDVCKRLGIETIHDATGTLDASTPLDPQVLLIRLFLETAQVPWSAVRSLLAPGDLAAIQDLGLLMPPENGGDSCESTVALYPTEGLFIASDRGMGVVSPSAGSRAPSDVVFPAIGEATQRFVGLMPRTACGDFLELCSGTGIAALMAASRFADNAWAVDITERSTRFARFNAALNDIGNVTPLEGDLYRPVAGQTFDRIVANPPYVPALADEYIFRDAGEDGERVTWQILSGLPDHLRTGGDFYCGCLASDREGAPLEDRIRAALGDRAAEFDIFVGEGGVLDPTLYFARRAERGTETFRDVERRVEVFKRLGIRQFILAAVMIHRRDDVASRPPVTIRRQVSRMTRPRDLRWILDWHATAAASEGSVLAELLRSRPRANQHAQVRTIHRQHGGEWEVDRVYLVTPGPFVADANCPPAYATVFMACNGRLTGRELLQDLKERGVVPDDAPETDFAQLLKRLVEYGLLEVDDAADVPQTAVV